MYPLCGLQFRIEILIRRMLVLQSWFVRSSSGNGSSITANACNPVAMPHFALSLSGYADMGISIPLTQSIVALILL